MANPLWVASLVLLLGCSSVLATDIVQQQQEDSGSNDYFIPIQQQEELSQVKGDVIGSPSEAVGSTRLGFDGILQRHDGYVKGETPTIPKTSFSCSAQQFNPGLYADVETQCQVYHVCFGDRQESFLCGPGTNFNQKILGCDFWYNFDCQDSPSFYKVNSGISDTPELYRPTGQPSIPGSVGISQRPINTQFTRDEQRPVPHDDYRPRPPVPAPPPRVPSPPPSVSVQPRPSPVPIPLPPSVKEPSYPPPVIHRPPPPPPPPPQVHQPIPPPQIRPAPPVQQQVDTDYNFEGNYPRSRPSIPPPRPALPPLAPNPVVRVTNRPVFPPVVSPPRITRPPVQTPVIVERPVLSPKPVISIRPQFPTHSDHPDSQLKGSTGYRPIQRPPHIPESSVIDVSYPSHPPPRPVSAIPTHRPSLPPLQQEHVKVDYIPIRTPPPPPRPVHQDRVEIDYIPSRPPPPPPPPRPIQQEHVEVDYIPSRSPPPPPPPPRPVQQEHVEVDYIPSRPPPPPPRTKQPIRPQPQPPVSPSVISERQKPQVVPPSRTLVTVSTRPQQPQRPRPVFPPASDHPNANIKGGPGYQQPPPQPPKFEPTRIGNTQRDSTISTGRQPPPNVLHPPSESSEYKPSGVKRPPHVGSTGFPTPPTSDRIKQPSVPVGTDYRPPRIPSVSVVIPQTRPQSPAFPPPRPQIIDHPDAGIKGSSVPIPPVVHQPQRVQSPSSPVSGVKRPQSSVSYENAKPQYPPSTGVKRPIKVPEDTYRPPLPHPPAIVVSRIKSPSQPSINKVLDTRPFPTPRPDPIDHPNVNLKGGPGYQPPQPQQPLRVTPINPPVIVVPPPSSSTTSQRKTVSPHQEISTGRDFRPSSPSSQKTVYPGRDTYQPPIEQGIYETHERPPVPSAPRDSFSGVKQSTSYQQQRRPQTASHQKTVRVKQPQQDYNTGSNYKRGSESYPKPEFQQPAGRPYQPPISTPFRPIQTVQQIPVTKTRVTQDVKPQYPAFPGGPVHHEVTGPRQPSGSSPHVDYPYREIPGHQPPHQPQVFPHRENPDHPNESLKGSSAYRPPPPAGFQSSASETVIQKTLSDGSVVDSSKLGDVGSE